MRRALLLSSILPPLAVAGASILLRHHIERSVPLEGAHRHPFPHQQLPLQPHRSPPVGRCACALISLLFRLLQVTILAVCTTTRTSRYPLSYNCTNFSKVTSVFLCVCQSGVSFRSVSVAGVCFAGCSGGRRCTVLALEVGFFTFMLPF